MSDSSPAMITIETHLSALQRDVERHRAKKREIDVRLQFLTVLKSKTTFTQPFLP